MSSLCLIADVIDLVSLHFGRQYQFTPSLTLETRKSIYSYSLGSQYRRRANNYEVNLGESLFVQQHIVQMIRADKLLKISLHSEPQIAAEFVQNMP